MHGEAWLGRLLQSSKNSELHSDMYCNPLPVFPAFVYKRVVALEQPQCSLPACLGYAAWGDTSYTSMSPTPVYSTVTDVSDATCKRLLGSSPGHLHRPTLYPHLSPFRKPGLAVCAAGARDGLQKSSLAPVYSWEAVAGRGRWGLVKSPGTEKLGMMTPLFCTLFPDKFSL